MTSDKSPIDLTDAELQAEADALAMRIARSSLSVRDAGLVMEMAVRLGRAPSLDRAVNQRTAARQVPA